MRHPNIITLSPEWLKSLEECSTEIEPGRWVPSRALGFASGAYRIRAAWMVFMGRADALVWPGQQ